MAQGKSRLQQGRLGMQFLNSSHSKLHNQGEKLQTLDDEGGRAEEGQGGGARGGAQQPSGGAHVSQSI